MTDGETERRSGGVRALLDAVRRPVGDEARALLARSWAGLAPAMRVPQQMFGRQGNGCGATIGAMPRCDFACRGCYLNAEANRVPAEPVEAIKAQMRLLRPSSATRATCSSPTARSRSAPPRRSSSCCATRGRSTSSRCS
jgi:hypothetical protein